MKKSVLFLAEGYYVSWYLSRELRKLGWKADVLSMHPEWDSYSHGADFRIPLGSHFRLTRFLFKALFKYDLFVFTGYLLPAMAAIRFITRILGKKMVYVSTGCNDGNLQSTVEREIGLCQHCGWPPGSCTVKTTTKRGRKRNQSVDLVYAPDPLLADFNSAPFVDYPFYYCINAEFWQPNLLIPANHRLCNSDGKIRVFHGMANVENRSHQKKNAKGTPAVLDAIDRLQREGYPLELVYVAGLPGKDVRFYLDQSDIVVEQLYYGWVGSTAREAMAMGKPVIANLNPAWARNLKEALPDYDLPVIHATVTTVYQVLKDLIDHPEKRAEAGARGRRFALRWLDSRQVAKILDVQWSALLNNRVITIRGGQISGDLLNEILNKGSLESS